ncbi:MAG TPA: acyl-CoA dehydratase activase [Thermodesulfobacteriota bacterium]|nr:acyl-CoA dehydratase activase [Thermodesulfobacteriota bacterium]
MAGEYFLGIDIGSISANTVIVNSKKEILEEHYHRLHGQPITTVRSILENIFTRIPPFDFENISFVGSGGKILAQLLNAQYVNEIIAQSKAIEWLHPQVKTVIEMGGEDSKLIVLDYDPARTKMKLVDFSMNTICAAGTGSFLDQQAIRLGLSIEEFGALALKSVYPPRLAGRCSVFAKSDMIHLQQIATPDYDIVAGLCFAVARNFKSTIGKGISLRPPVAFQGGVAANLGMRRAFVEVLELAPEEFIIPKYFASMGAIGACLMAIEDPANRKKWQGWQKLETYITALPPSEKAEQPLSLSSHKISVCKYPIASPDNKKKKAYLGVDVGSISTNVVVIDEQKHVLAKCYLMTAGRPIEAIKQGLKEVGEKLNDRVEIRGVGTTGSGRYLTGDFIGADVVRNEITAQATAAAHSDPEVDTIFEIGGQDSKYISLKNGAVIDFEMNKVCAAGTGSFLEEQAEKLGISIKDEFSRLALSAPAPVSLGERCTVFMESDLVHHQQQGANQENLVAGLCYSIVHNYLNKVVGKKHIGERIFFQGGTAFNQGVVAAFEKVLNKSITVPPDHEVTGAIGAAILAMEEKGLGPSLFKGFDLSKKEYELSSFECKGCLNMCEIHTLTVKGEKPLYYGGRCERYEIETKKKDRSHIPDLFTERESLLQQFEKENEKMPASAPVIGIPRVLFFYDLLPFWAAYFNALGFRVVLSDPTNKKLIREGLEAIVTETCFPIKVAHGHVLNLLHKNIKTIFFPSLINFKQLQPNITQSFACPYVQSSPYIIQSAIDLKQQGIEFIHIPLFMAHHPSQLEKELLSLALRLKRTKTEHHQAFSIAFQAQKFFNETLRQRGKQILSQLDPQEKAFVIVSRAYNGCDPGINLRIPLKLREMGVKAIPLDMLPLEDVDISEKWRGMYWAYGQKILAAAQIIKKDARLFPIYITNFSCGPDSFISHYFRKELADKPFLQIEVDEHSADAGVVTRLEAFLDSLKNIRPTAAGKISEAPLFIIPTNGKKRVIFIPRMADHAYALAAAFQACGNPAEVLPESDAETIKLGRKYTSGRECYPCILTTGNMVKATQRPGFDPEKSAFFMPSSNGPCRFGQYVYLHRLVLEELGFYQVPIFAFNQDDAVYQQCAAIGNEFSRLAWQGIVAIDLLDKKLHEIRPYEKHCGETNYVYQHYLQQVFNYIKGKKELTGLLRNALRDFENISIEKGVQKPVIGIVGEIYIRSNQFSNENIVGQIESLGGEAWLPPIGEWILYTNFTALRRTWENRSWSNLLKTFITNIYQKFDEHHLSKIFAPRLKNYPEPSTKQTIRNAQPYLDPTFEGEAILSIGKVVDFIRKGVHGIINVMPFTCMPGTIVTTLLKKLREIEKNIPALTMSYDGQEQTNTRTRLEAFMYQVNQFQKND